MNAAARRRVLLWAAGLFLLFPTPPSIAQGAPAEGAATSAADPSSALSEALAAACARRDMEFARFLTAGNAAVFTRLATVTRNELMKRFVLLDAPGKPGSAPNPPGPPSVRCETPTVTVEMQLGGAEVHENLAFIPIELRTLGDRSETQARRIQFGLVRESGGWKLLSVGLLLLDLPTLEQQWAGAEIEANEREAIHSLRQIAEAANAYRRRAGRLPDSLALLGPASKSSGLEAAADLLYADLAEGARSGYALRYVLLTERESATPQRYVLAATPLVYGKTGRRSFFLDAAGAIHAGDHQGALASEADPRIDQR